MSFLLNSRIVADSELLKSEFRFSDPANSVENLTRQKPDQSRSPDIMGFYDETPVGGRLANPDKEYVWCCHCQKETHWKGYIVEDGTGHRFTIGNKCGLDHYGAAFDNVILSFNEKIARKGVLRAFHRLASKVETLDEEISEFLSCPVLLAFENKCKEMMAASPKGVKALQDAVGRGSLQGVITTRNFAAENERFERYNRAIAHFHSLMPEERRKLRDEGLKPELNESPIIDSKSIEFGYAIGISLLGLCDPRQNAITAKSALMEFRDISLKGTDLFASKQIAKIRRKLLDSLKILRKSIMDASFGELFFQPENLERVVSWSECYHGFIFKRDSENFVIEQESGSDVSIAPLKSSAIYSPKSLKSIFDMERDQELGQGEIEPLYNRERALSSESV